MVIAAESRSEVGALLQSALDSLNDALELAALNRAEILAARNQVWAILESERSQAHARS